MDRCTNCGKTGLTAGEQAITLDVGDRTFDGLIAGWHCPACGERFYAGTDMEAFEHLAAKWLAEHGVRTHEELRFMRKAVGIRAADLAAWLGVTPETVSHWETGKHGPDVPVRGAIAAIVLDTLRRETTTRDRLRVQEKPDDVRKVRLDVRAA
jgi:putative zinc finger/helix-turn-helix YgiT family protein